MAYSFNLSPGAERQGDLCEFQDCQEDPSSKKIFLNFFFFSVVPEELHGDTLSPKINKAKCF